MSSILEIGCGLLPAFVAVVLTASMRDDYFKESFEGERFALLRAVKRQIRDTSLYIYEDFRYGGEEAFNRRLRKNHPEAAARREKALAKKGSVSLPEHDSKAGAVSDPEG